MTCIHMGKWETCSDMPRKGYPEGCPCRCDSCASNREAAGPSARVVRQRLRDEEGQS